MLRGRRHWLQGLGETCREKIHLLPNAGPGWAG